MATYYHDNSSSEIQAADGGIQTVYLINPNYMPNNYNSDTLLLPHAPPPNHHQPLVGIPLPSPSINVSQTTTSENNTNMKPNRSSCPHGVYSAGLDGRDLTQSQPQENPLAAINSHNQIGYLGHAQGGLSLSLSSQAAAYGSGKSVSANVFDIQTRGSTTPSVGTSGVQSVVLESKYLRAAQEILDEVVNVGDAVMKTHEKGIKEKLKMISKESKDVNGESSNLGENSEAELTAGQRQELQIKKSKLVAMLDEVEQRYRQYHHQMQMAVSSFEQAAGFASGKTYTALALHTISKQFRCLKDAISSQIKSTCKKLGEEASSSCLGAKSEGSRLRYVDHQLRQQHALQKMGIVQQPNAWRPQRGLPERAVSVLRAWLFENFLHPYPKDSDKHMLAKQTGLTRSQVSNWFINARVRLWKPMVEEMYSEEMKEDQRRDGSDENTNGSGSQNNKNNELESTTTIPNPVLVETADKLKNQQVVTSPTNDTQLSNSSMSAAMRINFHQQTCFNLIGSSSSSDIVQRSSKKPRNDTYMEMEQKCERLNDGGGYRLIGNNIGAGFTDTFTVEDIGRFNSGSHDLPAAARFHGNGVSLTLGLQHCDDNKNITFSGTQQNFMSTQEINHLGRRGLKLSSSTEPGYGSIESIQNTKRFATQLMPDFMT